MSTLPNGFSVDLDMFETAMMIGTGMANNDNLSSSEKTYWTLAFLFMNVFAAVFYYVTQYRRRY